MRYSGRFCSRCDRGLVRKHNEDNVKIVLNSSGDVLLLVADGIGGYTRGEVASQIAIDVFVEAFLKKSRICSVWEARRFIMKNLKIANKKIFNLAREIDENEHMGTTLIGVLIARGKLFVFNIGDSRAYTFSNGKLKQISEDQTYVKFLVRTKQITKEEAKTHPLRHVLNNALGSNPSVNVDLHMYNYHGETVFLCSDGLYNHVSDREIEAILATTDNVEQKTEILVTLANNKGGTDNIAVALWECDKND